MDSEYELMELDELKNLKVDVDSSPGWSGSLRDIGAFLAGTHKSARDKLNKKLNLDAKSMRAIYLDTCYWIRLRNSALGRNWNAEDNEIYRQVIRLYVSGKYFFPVSDAILAEVILQSEDDTRIPTARIMSKLCRGISVRHHGDRIKDEVASSVLGMGASEITRWVPANLAVGEPKMELEISRDFPEGFLNDAWDATYVEIAGRPFLSMVEAVGHDAGEHISEIAQRINKMPHAQKGLKENDIRICELISCIDSHSKMPLSEYIVSESANRIMSNPRGYPTIRVYTGILGMFRANRGQKLIRNDLLDVYHASAAVGNCLAFLTESTLKRVCERVGLDKEHGTRIISARTEAVCYLQGLA